MPKFYGESAGMLSVHFVTRELAVAPWRILRALTTRGLPQALNVVRSHLRNALVDVLPLFLESVPAPCPAREMLVNISPSARIGWLKSLLRSMPRNSEFRSLCAAEYAAGFGNLPALARCALKPHTKFGYVQTLELALSATWAQLTSLLNQPSIRGFREITITTTKVALDGAELRAILSSSQSQKLHVVVSDRVQPQDALLTLPKQSIRDFLDPHNASNFITESSLFLEEPSNVAFSEMPNVEKTPKRRKRFRHHIRGTDTVVRVSVYENRTTRKDLTVVTFDHCHRAVLFLNGNVSLADLKSRHQRPSIFFYRQHRGHAQVYA